MSAENSVIAVLEMEQAPLQWLKHLAKYLTHCLSLREDSKQFKKRWGEYCDPQEEDSPSAAINGLDFLIDGTYFLTEDQGLPLGILQMDVPNLFCQAINEQADRFIACEFGEYSFIIAVRGNPGIKELSTAINDSSELIDGDEFEQIQWPHELSNGVYIHSFTFSICSSIEAEVLLSFPLE